MPRRILVVDGDRLYLCSAQGHFEAAGFEVDTASSLATARLLLERRRYAVVILDMRLGNLSAGQGLSVLLLARPISTRTPIIIITDTPSVEAVCKFLGDSFASDFLSKAEGLEALGQSVLKVIDREDSFPDAISA